MKDIDGTLNELINQVEWSVKVPGAVEVDREKENLAKSTAKKDLLSTIKASLPEKRDPDMWVTLSSGQNVRNKDQANFNRGYNQTLKDVEKELNKLFSHD